MQTSRILSPIIPNRWLWCVAAVALLLLGAGEVAGPQPLVAQESGTYVSPRVRPYVVNIDLSTLPPTVPPIHAHPRASLPDMIPRPHSPSAPDPLWKSQEFGALVVTPPEFSIPSPNFPGMINGGFPQDTNGAPGRNHYIQAINVSFAIWDKSGNLLSGPTAIDSLWGPPIPATDPCAPGHFKSDPYVVYDHLADRWVISQLASEDSSNALAKIHFMCLAVSQGANPVTSGWYAYTFDILHTDDYPKLGLWPDGYYLITQEGYNGGNLDATVFDRANMLNGNPAGFQQRSFLFGDTIIALPSELNGPLPPGGSPNFYVRPYDGDLYGNGSDRIEIFEYHVDWGVPANTGFTLVQSLPVAAFASDICAGSSLGQPCIPQPSTANLVDAQSIWPMGPLHYRNFGDHETLVFTHVVNVDGNGLAGMRWYELRRSPVGAGPWVVQQQATFSPPDGQAIHRWTGSIAIDKAGDMALGYSASNDGIAPHNAVFPSVRYAGRLASDPLGELPHGEVTMAAGTSSQTSGTRWGDYSAMRVDPVDECTFWYTTEFITGTLPSFTRSTQIGAFRFPTCNPADLAITKIDSPDPVSAGSQLNYTITVANHGSSDATQVVVTDTLPSAVVFLSSSIPCVGGAIKTCSIGNLASGASTSFTMQVRVLASTPPGSITNTATVSGHELDPDTSNNTATATTQIVASADLAIAKECKPDQPNTQPAGTTTFCEIYVDNLGPSDAQNVVITDRIIASTPVTITAIVSSTTVGGAAVCAPAPPIGPTTGTTITCTDSVLPAGARDTIRVEFTAANSGDVDDTATVASATPDPDSTNNVAKGRVSFAAVSDLRLTKTDAPDPVIAGTDLTYHLVITNAGPSSAANVVVHDALPAQVSFVSATPSSGMCQAGVVPGDPSKPLTCNFGTIAASAGAMLDVVVRVNSDVPRGTILVNNADVSSDSADPNNSNNVATASTTVDTSADLAIVKTSDATTYKPSSVVTYQISVQNNGPSKALAAVVTDNLPEIRQAIYQSDTGGCVLSTPTTLTCNVGDLAVGETRTFFIYVLVRGSRGAVSNTASITSATADPVAANNTSTRVVTIGK